MYESGTMAAIPVDVRVMAQYQQIPAEVCSLQSMPGDAIAYLLLSAVLCLLLNLPEGAI